MTQGGNETKLEYALLVDRVTGMALFHLAKIEHDISFGSRKNFKWLLPAKNINLALERLEEILITAARLKNELRYLSEQLCECGRPAMKDSDEAICEVCNDGK